MYARMHVLEILTQCEISSKNKSCIQSGRRAERHTDVVTGVASASSAVDCFSTSRVVYSLAS